jgi:hypothetical protein
MIEREAWMDATTAVGFHIASGLTSAAVAEAVAAPAEGTETGVKDAETLGADARGVARADAGAAEATTAEDLVIVETERDG